MDRKAKVLIIDDEEDFCHFVKLNLERSGKFQVWASTKAVTGINTAKIQQPDVILLDIMLPKLDGYKVCRILKFDEKFKNIPIIRLGHKPQ